MLLLEINKNQIFRVCTDLLTSVRPSASGDCLTSRGCLLSLSNSHTVLWIATPGLVLQSVAPGVQRARVGQISGMRGKVHTYALVRPIGFEPVPAECTSSKRDGEGSLLPLWTWFQLCRPQSSLTPLGAAAAASSHVSQK